MLTKSCFMPTMTERTVLLTDTYYCDQMSRLVVCIKHFYLIPMLVGSASVTKKRISQLVQIFIIKFL